MFLLENLDTTQIKTWIINKSKWLAKKLLIFFAKTLFIILFIIGILFITLFILTNHETILVMIPVDIYWLLGIYLLAIVCMWIAPLAITVLIYGYILYLIISSFI